MRILHVIPAVAPRYGGPSSAIFEMCKAVQGHGDEVLLATTDADGEGRLPVETGVSIIYKGLPTIFFPRQFSRAFGYSRPLARWLNHEVKRFDAVHIHAIFSHACVAAARACRRSGVPYVVRPLGSLDPWSMRQKHWRKRMAWPLGVAQMLDKATAIHYTTIEEQRLAESSLGLKRGIVIPLGLDMESFRVSPDAVESIYRDHPALGENPYLLVLSRLHAKKNLESLIKAFISLIKQTEFAHWRLIIAGDGESDYTARLKQLASASNANGRIIFTGWLDEVEKISMLKRAALLVLPSYQENFGLCVVEALACGVPVVVSRQVNLASEIEQARAGWVAGQDARELEVVLADALRDPIERRQRGRAGRDFVSSRLAWINIAAELTALYRSFAATPCT